MNDVKGIIISSKCEVDTQADFFLCLLAIGRAKGKRMGECNIEDKNWGNMHRVSRKAKMDGF